ncbi:hypothetical protein KBY58_08220 [Cyanobium sp. HWJ4-Hawea]|nr:hypothetical protein [Cyanobium sp. HWJ4-Hawea]
MSGPRFAAELLLIALAGAGFCLTSFCMVKVVLQTRQGLSSPLRCLVGVMLTSCIVWALKTDLNLAADPGLFPATGRVGLGGFLFGLAAYANGGCFIGSMNQLAQGQGGRIWTLGGWVLGYLLLAPLHGLMASPAAMGVGLVAGVLAAALLTLEIQALRRATPFTPNDAIPGLTGSRAWALMLGMGVVMALLIVSVLPWQPSDLAKHLAESLAGQDRRVALVAGLSFPLGMLAINLWRRKFQAQAPRNRHVGWLGWGLVMVVGAELALGGNDSQLFRFIPMGSPHALLGVPAMAAGILVADWISGLKPWARA